MSKYLITIALLLILITCSNPAKVVINNENLRQQVVDSLLSSPEIIDGLVTEMISRQDVAMQLMKKLISEPFTFKFLETELATNQDLPQKLIPVVLSNPKMLDIFVAQLYSNPEAAQILLDNEEKQRALLNVISQNKEMMARMEGWILSSINTQ